MEIAVGDLIYIRNEQTSVIGFVDGVKYDKGELERVSIENMDYWFWVQKGWQFEVVEVEEEKDGQI